MTTMIDAGTIADYLEAVNGDVSISVWQRRFGRPAEMLSWLDGLGIIARASHRRNRRLCVPVAEAARRIRGATYARAQSPRKFASPDPWAALMLAVLRQAKNDAARGDLDALAWLITDGAPFAALVMEDGDDLVLEFAREIVARFPKGDLLHAWGLDADDAQLEFPL
jgi:hypothetical protein